MYKTKLCLPELIAEVRQQLIQMQYRHITVANYGYIWRDLLKFAAETHTDYISAEFAESFLLQKM